MALITGDNSGAGVGLTSWRNKTTGTDTKFASAELIPCDQMLGWNYRPLHYNMLTPGVMAASRVSDRYSASRNAIVWTSMHAFQTCQFVFWLMQTTGGVTYIGRIY